MNSHVFLNGLNDEVYILDDKADPDLFRVMPDRMNHLNQRCYQQPAMVPDVVKEGVSYQCVPEQIWNPALHPVGCQCEECRSRRVRDHTAIYQDLGYLQNADRKFVIDLNSYAFDTQSTKDYNQTMAQFRISNQPSIPVLSKLYLIKLLYIIISVDENGNLLGTQDGAIQTQAEKHYYTTLESDAEGQWIYYFMDLHNSDTIVIPTMYGAQSISLNLRGIEVYARTTGYSLETKNDEPIYVNTGIRDILLYRNLFGVEYRGYAYDVLQHDRIRINFSVLFNNLAFVTDLTSIPTLREGLDYRTCEFETVPSWYDTKLWTGTNVIEDHFIPISNPQSMQEQLDFRLSRIPLPA